MLRFGYYCLLLLSAFGILICSSFVVVVPSSSSARRLVSTTTTTGIAPLRRIRVSSKNKEENDDNDKTKTVAVDNISSSEDKTKTAVNNISSRRKKESLRFGHDPLLSLNLNLDSLAKRNTGGLVAQELLQRIDALYREGYYAASPDTVSYNSVLNAWKEQGDPERALELLQEMLIDQDHDLADVISFNTVVLAFAKDGHYRQAEQILSQMQSDELLPDPDTITYNSVLYAYAQSKEPGVGGAKAEALLREMINRSTVRPDTTSFNTVLHAWAQNPANGGAQRAEDLLQRMERDDTIRPDVYSYSSVIQAWAKSGETQAPEKCRALLKQMEELAEKGRSGLKPNFVTYSSVMSALARSGKPQQAQELLETMMERAINNKEDDDIQPDVVSFSVVIDGWAKNAHCQPLAAERALELFHRMKQLHHQGHKHLAPNSITYTSVLSALGKTRTWDACIKAESLLDEMHADKKDDAIKPTVIHYNAVLDAFAKSPRADKALSAKALFDKMNQNNIRPDIITYNSVLQACANSFGDAQIKNKALDIAFGMFRAVIDNDNDVQPNSATFAIFLKAQRKLIPSNHRWKMLSKTFQLCCQKGLVNDQVLQQLKNSHGKEWKLLLGENNNNDDASHMPHAWTCNSR